jgi:hypothetical protein
MFNVRNGLLPASAFETVKVSRELFPAPQTGVTIQSREANGSNAPAAGLAVSKIIGDKA